MTLGIIGGTSLLFSELPALEERRIATPFGGVDLLVGDIVILMRHQDGIPPHRINYRAHLSALAIAGVDRIIAFGSSGSLQKAIAPGSLVIPDDYISAAGIPSVHDNAIVHVSPKISADLMDALARVVPDARRGGIYVQTKGPRLETIAEVKTLARFADIVGMTLASEATVACELDMDFAAICTVDNYANGLGTTDVSYEHILEVSRQNSERTGRLVAEIIRHLG